MNLEARAPKIGLNLNLSTRNFLLAVMCAVFAAMFLYDGFYNYPRHNDAKVRALRDDPATDPEIRALAVKWTRWADESSASREAMNEVLKKHERVLNLEGWKSPFDVTLQQGLAIMLVVVNVWSISRLVRFGRKRVACDDQGISPRRGLAIPWDKITRVDNTRWRSSDLVEITYLDAAGATQKVMLDGQEVQYEPLVNILDQMAQHATAAEFLPKEEPKAEAKGPAAEASQPAEGSGAPPAK